MLKRAVALLGEKKNELITLDDLRKQAEQGKFWVLKRDIQAATDIMAGCSDVYAVPLEFVWSCKLCPMDLKVQKYNVKLLSLSSATYTFTVPTC